MRKLLCFLLVAACCMAAPAARADLGPPVHVRLLGEPRAAEAGVPWRGQLEVVTDVPASLANFAFAGEGWTTVALDAPASVSVAKSQAVVVDFEIVPVDPDQPVEFSFEMDGHIVTQSFDLSPAHLEQMTHPGVTGKVSESDIPAPADPSVELVRPEPASIEGAQLPQTGEGEKARNIRVHGRFTYQRWDGVTIGADAVTFKVWDNDSPFPAELLASGVTDAFGWYDVTFYWNPCAIFCDAEPDIYVTFDCENGRVRVEDATWSIVYSWVSGTVGDYTGGDLDFGWLQPSDQGQHPALHQLTDLSRTWRWFQNNGYDTPFVRCNWPNGTGGGAFYNGEIFVAPGSQWEEHVHSHEYGHHWVQMFSTNPAFNYCNGICDGTPPNCGHCIWCQESANIAYMEGIPDYWGDVIPSGFVSAYGVAARFIYDTENLYTCGGSLDDPNLTEGFMAAVARDIDDSTNDDHAAFPQTDALSLGGDEILTVLDLDNPITPMAFLNAFKNRYPGWRGWIWQTARNCGYDIDVDPPLAVTNLTSTSHSTIGDSPDPTIDYSWTPAYDDASLIQGYGVFISGGCGFPSAVLDIGDVTTYTTPALAPGTYYFSIRAVDRDGRWSNTYACHGPITIRAAVPANLTFYQFPGWSRVVVPREAADASFSYVPDPVTLPGDAWGTWWNLGGWNNGEQSTGVGFESHAYVDGNFHWWWAWGAIGSGGGFYGNNGGALYIPGGRHTFEGRVDALDQISETNEFDNRWAHQWVWTPATLTANTATARWAPPLKTAGWDAISDGSYYTYNQDGVRMSAAQSGWWNAVVMRPLDSSEDYDLYLHSAATGASSGFDSFLQYSGLVSGYIDAVIVNRNTVGWADYDAGVVNYNGAGGQYEVTHVTNSSHAFDTQVTYNLPDGQMMELFEFYVSTADVGPVSIVVDTDPVNGPLAVQWLSETYTTGTLYSYTAQASTDGSGRARLDVNIGEDGYNCVVVYRHPNFSSKNTGSQDFTLRIHKTPPDFTPLYASGWHSPLVPRPAFDGTWASTPLPSILYGDQSLTYLNVAVTNASPTDAVGLPAQIHLDGVYTWWLAWGYFPGYAESRFNWDIPWWVSGGRHMMALRLDNDAAYEEIHETNNIHGEQYSWLPSTLTLATPVVRGAPPDPVGGWADDRSGESLWYNCDGLRMPNDGGYWRAVAVMPGASSDVDLALHPETVDAKNGFTSGLAFSYWWAGQSDYVLVNFNLTGWTPYDAAITRYSGTEAYTSEASASSGWISYPDGIYGPYTLGADRIVNLHEFYLTPGLQAIRLNNLAGSVNWGLTLHPADQTYQSKSMAVPGGISWLNGAGQDEWFTVDITTAGWYCLAVWKNTSSDLPLAGDYQLWIESGLTAVPGDQQTPPAVTSLTGIHPNPFNPQTRIAFELAATQAVTLGVYDLQGTRVRTLVDEVRSAGRHEVPWDGRDDAGRALASGMYMARLVSGQVHQMQKMVLLK